MHHCGMHDSYYCCSNQNLIITEYLGIIPYSAMKNFLLCSNPVKYVNESQELKSNIHLHHRYPEKISLSQTYLESWIHFSSLNKNS
jgi:hypothetical protein